MNTFELEIWDDEANLCTFYTVKKVDDTSGLNETDKFFTKYENDPEFQSAIQELLSFILDVIGDDHGAVDALFNRHENQVQGLPSKGIVRLGEITIHYPDFPLRIYALRITEEIVVLFNGGIKDGPTNQLSSLNMQWMEACRFADRINEALRNGEILVDDDNRILTDHLGNKEIIL